MEVHAYELNNEGEEYGVFPCSASSPSDTKYILRV